MAAGARRVVVRCIFVRIERTIVLIELIGLIAARLAGLLGPVAHPVVGVAVDLVVRMAVELMLGLGVNLVIALAVVAIVAIGLARRQRVGIVVARRIRLAFRPARLSGGKALLAVGRRLPSGRGGRRRLRRRLRAAKLRERIGLPDQSGQLGERIAAAGAVALARRAPGAAIGIVRSEGSQRIVVRHTHSVSGTGVALGRSCDGSVGRKSIVPHTAPSEINASPQAPRRRAKLARTRER
jgi:hypothetical protein